MITDIHFKIQHIEDFKVFVLCLTRPCDDYIRINFMCPPNQGLIHKEMKVAFTYFFIKQLGKIVLCNA